LQPLPPTGYRGYCRTLRKITVECGNAKIRNFAIDISTECIYIQLLKRRFHAEEGKTQEGR